MAESMISRFIKGYQNELKIEYNETIVYYESSKEKPTFSSPEKENSFGILMPPSDFLINSGYETKYSDMKPNSFQKLQEYINNNREIEVIKDVSIIVGAFFIRKRISIIHKRKTFSCFAYFYSLIFG